MLQIITNVNCVQNTELLRGFLHSDDFNSSVLTGFFCEEWGLFEPTGPCQAGYYCIAGTPPPDCVSSREK